MSSHNIISQLTHLDKRYNKNKATTRMKILPAQLPGSLVQGLQQGQVSQTIEFSKTEAQCRATNDHSQVLVCYLFNTVTYPTQSLHQCCARHFSKKGSCNEPPRQKSFLSWSFHFGRNNVHKRYIYMQMISSLQKKQRTEISTTMLQILHYISWEYTLKQFQYMLLEL